MANDMQHLVSLVKLNNDLLILQLEMLHFGDEDNWHKQDRKLETLKERQERIKNSILRSIREKTSPVLVEE